MEDINEDVEDESDEHYQEILKEIGLKKPEGGVAPVNNDKMPIKRPRENTEESKIRRLELEPQLVR